MTKIISIAGGKKEEEVSDCLEVLRSTVDKLTEEYVENGWMLIRERDDVVMHSYNYSVRRTWK